MRNAHSFLLMSLLTVPLLQQWWPVVPTKPLRGVAATKQCPDLTPRSWWSGDFQNGFDRWHRENFGFRSTLVRIRNQKDYELYGKLHAENMVMGREHCLFFGHYLNAWSGADALSDERIGEMSQMLLDIQNGLKQRGKTFIVALAPGKASYFPEFVPPRYDTARRPRNNGEKMPPIFREAGINLIDYNRIYIAQKKLSDFPLYGKPGIHWSNYGAARSLQQFIERVERERGTDLPGFHIRNVRLSHELKAPDDDLQELINLMVPPPHEPLAIFDWEWESPEGHETPRLTVFADSFFFQFLDVGITPGCFRDVDYFYYGTHLWRHDAPWGPTSTERALKSVDESEVILILATEINYAGLGFGYLDALHAHLKVPPPGGTDPPDGNAPQGGKGQSARP